MMTVILKGDAGIAEMHYPDLRLEMLVCPRNQVDSIPASWQRNPGVYLLLSSVQNGWFSVHVGASLDNLRRSIHNYRRDDAWERAVLITKSGDTDFEAHLVAHLAHLLHRTLAGTQQAEMNSDQPGDAVVDNHEADLSSQTCDLVMSTLGFLGYRTTTKDTKPRLEEKPQQDEPESRLVTPNMRTYQSVVATPPLSPPAPPVLSPAVPSRNAPPTAPLSLLRKNVPLTDGELIANLRSWRRSVAVSESVPPYVIFTDKTMHALVEHRPISREELLRIPGLDPAKVDRYGARIAHVIAGTTP